MKTIINVLCCVAVLGALLGFYFCSSGDEERTTTDFKAYHKKGVDESTKNLEDRLVSKQQPEDLSNYNKYHYRYVYTIKVKGQIDKATLKLPIPQNEKGRQYISDLKLNPKPTKIFETNGNTIAEYNITHLTEGEHHYSIEGIANLKKYNIEEAKRVNKNEEPKQDLKRYLVSEKGIETSHDYIRHIASTIGGKNQEEIVSNILNYVKRRIAYNTARRAPSALNGLRTRQGQCGEYASAMVALCRAKGIPARIVSGNIARQSSTGHTWVEVYFPQYGWVTYEPTVIDFQINSQGRRVAYIKEQDYIASVRNDYTLWYLSYTNTDTGYHGSLSLRENVKIRKL